MNNIIKPNDQFDFSKLSLGQPLTIPGSAYFTKIEFNDSPLYIQTSKSQTKQGLVKSGKKYNCDLMFNKNDEIIITWFENLEERCRKLIFEKRDAWFQNSLEESDIETAFNSTIRTYKSGKFYLIRTNIKVNSQNIPSIKIYNEDEETVSMEDIDNETNVISILEIQGIKFTSRNFQIEIELKQMMVLRNEEKLFESCLIKPINNSLLVPSLEENKNFLFDNQLILFEDGEKTKKTVIPKNDVDNFDSINESTINDIDTKDNEEIANANSEFNLEIENLDEKIDNIEENNNELKEISDLELSLENNLETIQLKKPNQVYFELYKEARKKAKEAKKNAILAYLEAKNIKKTYMIDNLHDSDSDNDIDEEIEAVSDSELEGL